MLARLVVRLFFSPEGYVVHKRRSVVQISERYFREVYLRAFPVLGVFVAYFLVGSSRLLTCVNRGIRLVEYKAAVFRLLSSSKFLAVAAGIHCSRCSCRFLSSREVAAAHRRESREPLPSSFIEQVLHLQKYMAAETNFIPHLAQRGLRARAAGRRRRSHRRPHQFTA